MKNKDLITGQVLSLLDYSHGYSSRELITKGRVKYGNKFRFTAPKQLSRFMLWLEAKGKVSKEKKIIMLWRKIGIPEGSSRI